MALIKRLVKGSPLTFAEGDANLQYLEDLALSGSGGSINTGSFATTGSNTFYGLQTISSTTDLSALDIHVKDDILWTFRTYNDTYSSSSIGLASWIDNDGVSFLGTETDRPLHIYNNANYQNPSLLISSSGVTVNNQLIVNNGITGSLQGTATNAQTASYVLQAISSSYAITASYLLGTITSASFATTSITSSYPITVTGSTLRSVSPAGGIGSNVTQSIYFGSGSGNNASGSFRSNFFGFKVGENATNAYQSNFIGNQTGQFATNANDSNFFGFGAGFGATNSNFSNFIGSGAGQSATNANSSNFLGQNAGTLAVSASYSNFLGFYAGYLSSTSSFSTLIGYGVGYRTGPAGIGSNNIIIGTNITLPNATSNAINLGGIIFATGTYSTTLSGLGSPYSGTQYGIGKVGINIISPNYTLDVSGSGNYSNGLTVTGSLNAPSITGSLQGTASYALTSSFATTASYASTALSSSFALTASYQYPIALAGSTLRSVSPLGGVGGSLTGSIFLGDSAGSGATNAYYANFLGYYAGYNAVNAYYSNFIGNGSGNGATNANFSNFIGQDAGNGSTGANSSNFLGYQTGYLVTNAYSSNFLGYQAGWQATNAYSSNFLGYQAGLSAAGANDSNFLGNIAGYNAGNAYYSNFIGFSAGNSATNAYQSNFIGYGAGQGAVGANGSNFIGQQAGVNATNASYSTLIGFQAGYSFGGNNIGSNNIIIGTNISLPDATANAINLGGIIFAKDTYSNTGGDPSITPANGKVGINIVTPSYELDVSGSINFTGNLYQNGVLFGGSFNKSRTTANATSSVVDYDSIFNPSNLLVQDTSVFYIDSTSYYYVLGDLINSGSIVVDGVLKIGGTLYNSGSITGTGTII